MARRDYSHRDLCTATAGILEAYLDLSEDGDRYDEETVEAIASSFAERHEYYGAETPLPERYED